MCNLILHQHIQETECKKIMIHNVSGLYEIYTCLYTADYCNTITSCIRLGSRYNNHLPSKNLSLSDGMITLHVIRKPILIK